MRWIGVRGAWLGALVLCLSFQTRAEAGLLTASHHSQLETWLGEGPLVLNKIYDKACGDTSQDFHAQVDNRGRTFTLLEILPVNGYDAQIIGGYNPFSWLSGEGYRVTWDDADRTAFLFNLTTGEIQRQKPGPIYSHAIQTYNKWNAGPSWSFDLFVNHSLNEGYAYQYSYGAPGDNDTPGAGFNILGSHYGGMYDIRYGKIEVYAIENGATMVPEPASCVLLGVGVVGMAVSGVRRRKKLDPAVAA